MSEYKNIGYVQIKKDVLVKMCIKAVQGIKEEKYRQISKRINHFREEQNTHIRRRNKLLPFFKATPLLETDEETMDAMKKANIKYQESNFGLPCYKYSYSSSYGDDVLRDLASLACCCECDDISDDIQVSAEMINNIFTVMR